MVTNKYEMSARSLESQEDEYVVEKISALQGEYLLTSFRLAHPGVLLWYEDYDTHIDDCIEFIDFPEHMAQIPLALRIFTDTHEEQLELQSSLLDQLRDTKIRYKINNSQSQKIFLATKQDFREEPPASLDYTEKGLAIFNEYLEVFLEPR